MPTGIYKRIKPAWNKGTSLSEETKRKIRAYRHTDEAKEKMRIAHTGKRGYKHKEETKRKISLSNSITQKGKKKPWKAGANNHFWKGGITKQNEAIRKSLEYRIWRTAVFERDNYTCIWCFQKGGKLHADHIKPFAYFPDLRFAIDNGRTLCEACHKTTNTYSNRYKTYEHN